MIINADGIRIYPPADSSPDKVIPTTHEIDEMLRLRVINDPLWPAQHNTELARIAGEKIAHAQHLMRRAGLSEDSGNFRDAWHQALFTSMTWAATRAVESGRIHAAALGGEANDEWASFTQRQQRRRTKLANEAAALHAGLVGGKSGNKRCSPGAREARREQMRKQEEFLASRSVYNVETGQFFSLAAPKDKFKSRLAELYTFAKGLEKIITPEPGQLPDYEWARAIITVPAHMHVNPEKGYKSWDGTLPNEAARYLAEGWADVRARLAKFNITCSGFWTREAHKDGTPHINFFLIFPAGEYREVARAMKEVYGKSKRATNIMKGNDERAREALETKGKKPASFASYAMKYFNKNFQAEPDEDAEGEDVTASTFGYRRYGFFGLPARSIWRELRRARTCDSPDPLIKSAWQAAHRGDAAEFIMLAGGLACSRSQRPLQPLRRVVFKDKTVQVITEEQIETPFDMETEIITTRISDVIGVLQLDESEVDARKFIGWLPDKELSEKRLTKTRSGAMYTKIVRSRAYKTVCVKKMTVGVAFQTRTPGLYEIISTAEAVVREEAAKKAAEKAKEELQDKNKNTEEVTVVLNYPRGEAAPPPETPKRPPCSAHEYTLASG